VGILFVSLARNRSGCVQPVARGRGISWRRAAADSARLDPVSPWRLATMVALHEVQPAGRKAVQQRRIPGLPAMPGPTIFMPA
jgi:hypothetical protein